jgi:methyl-accepting chemotaxis protein
MRINHLATWQKLGLLVVPCIILAAVPATLYLRHLQSEVSRSVAAVSGARSARTVLEVIRLTQQHRGLSNGVLAGNAALVAPRDAKKLEVIAALQAMATATPKDASRLTAESSAISAAFAELAAAVDARTIAVPESFKRHTELIARMFGELEGWLDHHGLTFEEDPVSHYLVGVTYQSLPGLTESMGQARAHGTAMLTRRAPTVAERLFAAGLLERSSERLAAARSGLEKAGAIDEGVRTRLQAAMEGVDTETRRVIALARKELVDAPELTFVAAEYFALTTRTIDAHFQLLDRLAAEVVDAESARADARRRQRDAMLLGGIVLLVAVLAFAVAITRAITRPLARAVDVAGRIASGRLDNQIDPNGRDEVASLLAALDAMQDQLVAIVGRIQDAGASIREASVQTAAGNADLSSRTEEQASTIEQTAANMEELTSTVRQNTASASSAIAVATEALDQARKGGELVAAVVDSMGSIAESSRQVRDITETIDGIAFQTNLLALNAAVEAARAGEHGRGFAVVAAEVRSLSQRCAQAAQEIRKLIQKSALQVEEGKRQAGVAGSAVGRLVESVGTVAQRVNDIAAASVQQRAGIEQVNQAVAQLESVTQQNAALVEEAAANAMSLERQAEELAAAVDVFDTGRDRAPYLEDHGQRGAKLVRRTSAMPPPPSLPSTIS